MLQSSRLKLFGSAKTSGCSIILNRRSSRGSGDLSKRFFLKNAAISLVSNEARASTPLYLASPSPPVRFMSATSYEYEYPMRTEAPIITRTKASEAKPTSDKPDPTSVAKTPARIRSASLETSDHFDDKHTLDEATREKLLMEQKTKIATELDPRHKIRPQKPAYIPPNKASKDLEVPHTDITTLDNGLRVASQETYGQVATVGVFANVGSRHESEQTTGVNHLMELLAFQATATHPSAAEIVARMDTLGGSTFASSSREQLMYCVDILRPSVEEATEILASTILNPLITQEEVEELKQVMAYQMQDMAPELKMGEGLHVAAYKGSQLGRTHFCPPENIGHLNAAMVHDFRAQHFAAKDMVLAGAGIEHERLVELGQKYFSGLPSKKGSTLTIPSTYVGGEFRMESPTIDGFTRVAMACEVGGWHSDDLVPTCVLQILLGGGSSFSAGGPGKGMYSRLYREVLNRFYWAESAEAFTSFHSETGLLGISGSSKPDKSRDLTRVIAEHFARLTVDHVTDEELDRARNMLKCNVLTQLESRLVLFEDIGRQILTYGQREDTASMCAKIDAVTKEQIMDLARRAFFSKPPTLSAVGDDLSNVPKYEEFISWFNTNTV